MPSPPNINSDYISRINKVLAFVEENLERELSLEAVAEVAHYSPFHFHRIFKAITNETLNAYIIRKRIEKAASVLMRRNEVSITELSHQYGFNSNAAFTRAFKKFYGISPSQFRKSSPGKYSKISKVESKNGQGKQIFEEYICNIDNHINWIKMNANIEIKEMPKMNLACVNQIGLQGLAGAYDKLMNWARPKGLLDAPDVKMVTIYYDSLKITDHAKARMSACIVLNEAIETSGEVGLTTIEKGKFIVGRFEIGMNEFEKSWTGLFMWMNENGHKKAEQSPFGIYYNDFNEHPQKKCIVDLCISIE